MKILSGNKKTKTAVFISGKGSNLKNLIKFSKFKNSPIKIDLVISNNKYAKGLRHASKNKIEKKIFNFNNTKNAEKKSLKILLKKKINIDGPFPADTFFNKNNMNKYDLVVGMYHDQVLTPMKTIFGFKAINVTIGLPFIRISPDHGTNNKMIGTNKSNPQSFFLLINFLNKFYGR